MRPWLLMVAGATALLAGCAFDHRKEIAYDILYRSDGMENDKAFSAAISALFPAGTPVSALNAFVKANFGECRSDESSLYVCEIATRGDFCGARLLQIRAVVKDDLVESVTLISGGLGC